MTDTPQDIHLPMFGGLVHVRIQTKRPLSPGTWDRMVRALGLLRSVCAEDADAGCASCGRPYGSEHGFPDLCVSREVWQKISPTGDDGGLLCPSCMCRLAYENGIESAEAVFRSGPFARFETMTKDLDGGET